MPKERTIPGYFDAIASEHSASVEGLHTAEQLTERSEKDQMKEVKTSPTRRKQSRPRQPRAMPARAFISVELNVMLGLYKMRVRHIWGTSRSYGEILEDAFCYYIKSHDREAYDEFVTKGLTKR